MIDLRGPGRKASWTQNKRKYFRWILLCIQQQLVLFSTHIYLYINASIECNVICFYKVCYFVREQNVCESVCIGVRLREIVQMPLPKFI